MNTAYFVKKVTPRVSHTRDTPVSRQYSTVEITVSCSSLIRSPMCPACNFQEKKTSNVKRFDCIQRSFFFKLKNNYRLEKLNLS